MADLEDVLMGGKADPVYDFNPFWLFGLILTVSLSHIYNSGHPDCWWMARYLTQDVLYTPYTSMVVKLSKICTCKIALVSTTGSGPPLFIKTGSGW